MVNLFEKVIQVEIPEFKIGDAFDHEILSFFLGTIMRFLEEQLDHVHKSIDISNPVEIKRIKLFKINHRTKNIYLVETF